MSRRRWVLTPIACALFAAASLSWSPVIAGQQNQKLDKVQQQETQAAARIADAVAAGQPVTADIGMSIKLDSVKALNSLTRVPFVLSLDPAQVPASKAITLYLRLVARTPVPAAAPAAASAGARPAAAAPAAPEFAFQGAHFIDLKAPAPGEPYRVTRAFSVPAGDYDLYVIVKDRAPVRKGDKSPQKAGFLKQVITVPDLWGGGLTTSSVILIQETKILDRPLTAEQEDEQPYTFGMNAVVPASGTRFSRKSELAATFYIYNTAQDRGKKPDIAVEYGFYQRTPDKGEKFFNKTQTQMFNAASLPAAFDADIHALRVVQSVPLAPFPEGEYRLEIKVTDKLSGSVITRNIPFSVVP